MVETTLIAYHEATRELVVIEGVIAPPFLFLISKTVIHSEEGGGVRLQPRPQKYMSVYV